MNKIIRVFPKRTSLTPKDDLAFIGHPPEVLPPGQKVHISVTFTWDTTLGNILKQEWSEFYDVEVGGPAFGSPAGEFEPGMYLGEGVTITSRGCYRKCPWCFVPTREGNIQLLQIKPGWIVQDNNILATPRFHQEKVYEMLRRQRKYAKFAGGLDTQLVNDWVIDQFKNMGISEVFLAADTKGSLRALARATEKLSFLGRKKLRCYVMIGYEGETIEEAIERLEAVWDIGCLPFSQLFQPPGDRIEYSKEWRTLNREWSRPAIMAAKAKEGLLSPY